MDGVLEDALVFYSRLNVFVAVSSLFRAGGGGGNVVVFRESKDVAFLGQKKETLEVCGCLKPTAE